MMYFSRKWEIVPWTPGSVKRTHVNIHQVRVTFLDEQGQKHVVSKYYEGWIGICTNHIEKVVQMIQQHFPGHKVIYVPIGNVRKILPYFETRLAKGKLDYQSKPFYKVYTTTCIRNIGRFFNRFKFSYYEPEDWLNRIYIDLCTKYNSRAFYYKWYHIHPSPNLMDSFEMLPDRNVQPDWTFAAFDLESVPLIGNHIPIGYHPTDRIVMISLVKWNKKKVEKRLLYVLPDGIDQPLQGYRDFFQKESDMLIHFHQLLEDVHVLTGYNINSFDFPCLFSRILWLKLYSLLRCYTSANVGTDVVVSYQDKITIDLYSYFKTFSGYNLPSFKLDDVARIKLEGDSKIPIKSTGLWTWYRYSSLTRTLFESDNVEDCFRIMKPETVSRASDFGTFGMYLDYCLRDSELVHRLFEKEFVLSFLVERANFTALNAVEALHLGNSRYLLELFQTYGTRLGYFINPKFFAVDSCKNELLLNAGEEGKRKTYQGALNFCYSEQTYENVVVMDFASMYPSTLLSSNLCYGTCTILSREEWLATPAVHTLTTIPYRHHSNLDFEKSSPIPTEHFSYPVFDPEHDEWAIVINPHTKAFLPEIVGHFINMRQYHQRQWKATQDIYHYNVQLGIKILINSLYGVMANKDSPLTYLVIAIIIVTLSRYQLLGSYHYLKNAGYHVCYADTDSLMVHRWPENHCDRVNAFLNLPHVELKFEQRMKRFLILSKKRYVYERLDGVRVTKGFQKKINGIIDFMTNRILKSVWDVLFEKKETSSTVSKESQGWIVWVETLLEAQYQSRDPKKYSIYRKIKKLDQYVSTSCAAVKFLKKYPDRTDEHVEFTYSMADVAACEASNWVVDVQDCSLVNYEQLFISQKKIFCTLLNIAFWHLSDPTTPTDQVLNAIHWKRFVHAELLHYHATHHRLLLLVEPTLKYTFFINDHLKSAPKINRKRKLNLG